MHLFYWCEESIEHVAHHDVTPEEFEEAFDSGADVVNRDLAGGHSARIGYDSRGRLLFVVYDDLNGIDIVPITAYEVDERWKTE
jgi:hypothetical protein